MSEEYPDIMAKWNADDIQLFNLFEIKSKILEFLNSREFEMLYWEIRKLWVELDAKMTETERTKFENSIKVLDTMRVEYIRGNKNSRSKTEIEFYKLLVNFYRDLCRMMKEHGLYYRESEDDRGL